MPPCRNVADGCAREAQAGYPYCHDCRRRLNPRSRPPRELVCQRCSITLTVAADLCDVCAADPLPPCRDVMNMSEAEVDARMRHAKAARRHSRIEDHARIGSSLIADGKVTFDTTRRMRAPVGKYGVTW